MKVYRKSLIVQMLLFLAFFLMGGNVILSHFMPPSLAWINFVFLGILILFGVLGFFIYKRPNQDLCDITQNQISVIRYLLYGYFFVYITQMVLVNFNFFKENEGNMTTLYVITGVVLMMIALFGLVYQYLLIFPNKKGDV
jgi:hypothetical protein